MAPPKGVCDKPRPNAAAFLALSIGDRVSDSTLPPVRLNAPRRHLIHLLSSTVGRLVS
jgi:hypothetical protein